MTERQDEKIPLFSSWTQWYLFVIIFLMVLIALFYLLTKKFS